MLRRLVFLATCLVANSAAALDYRSVTEAALMYDAPSVKANPVFAIAAGTPVEAVVVLEGWVKVRSASGALAWIQQQELSDQRTLLVSVDRAQVRSAADDNAPVVFEAKKNVLLDLIEPGPPGWAKVKHRDGQQGYVKVSQVWGL
jgi:SH3-like domain-containing protein